MFNRNSPLLGFLSYIACGAMALAALLWPPSPGFVLDRTPWAVLFFLVFLFAIALYFFLKRGTSSPNAS